MINRPIPAWALPLAVIALVVPAVGATLLLGSAAGLAAALATLVVVVALAARGSDGPIETATGDPEALVVLKTGFRPERDPDLVARYTGDADVHVVVPAPASRLERWLSATDEATAEAQARLDVALQGLARSPAQGEVHGEVGDPDPVRAVEDAARTHAVDEVVFISDDPADADAHEVGRRLARDVHILAG